MEFAELRKRLAVAGLIVLAVCAFWWNFSMTPADAPFPGAEQETLPPDSPAIVAQKAASALMLSHRAAGDAKNWTLEASLWKSLNAGPLEISTRRLIEDARANWLTRAVKENDDASADVLAASMAPYKAVDEVRARGALKSWRRRQYEKWRAARAAKNAAAASAALNAMSLWEPLDSDLPADILAVAPPDEVLATAVSAYKTGNYSAAALLARAATYARGDTSNAQALLDDAIIGLVDAMPPHDGPGYPPGADLLLRVNGARRLEAKARVASLLEAYADSQAEDRPEIAASLYDDAQQRVREASGVRLPPEDVLSRLADKASVARFSAILKKLDSNPEAAFRELRPIIRGDKNPDRRERAITAVRDGWRKARDQKRFDALVDFSAFWIAEIGPPAFNDPFYAEFKTTLVELAQTAKAEALNKQVFVLTMLADAFPADPEARDARRDAAARGGELALTVLARAPAPVPVAPSGVPGRSIALIENSTDHFIVMIFTGPEIFFVRVNPHRRGTVILKDGKYVMTVATIKDEIKPYSVEASLSMTIIKQTFVVYRGSEKVSSLIGSDGPWTVLRRPDGENYEISPLNGSVLR